MNTLINESFNFMASSPLEQFEVYPFASLYIAGLGDSVFTNLNFYDVFGTLAILGFLFLSDNDLSVVPNSYSLTSDVIYDTLFSIVSEQLDEKDIIPSLPWLYSLFAFVIVMNLDGNIPYFFAVTSSGIVCIGLSFSLWLTTLFMIFNNYKLGFFSKFLPQGTPFLMAPLLTLVELISYSARAVSLGIRLMANITAGHTLLKIIASFVYPLLTINIFNVVGFFILTLLPLGLLVLLVGLEVAVSFIQGYVFTVLTSSYIKDANEIH